MSLIVNNTIEGSVLNQLLTSPLTIKLFGNNITPTHSDTTSLYTEIAGGGYSNFPLIFANWTIKAIDPSTAIYNSNISWIFTGIINPPSTIYGYYVTRNSDNQLMWAERFPSGLVPFSPVSGSKIVVLPEFGCQSAF